MQKNKGGMKVKEKKIQRMMPLLAAAMTLCLMFAWSGRAQAAERYTEGHFGYEILADGTVEIVSYTGTEADLTVPSEIAGKKVTGIGESAFQAHDSLVRVKISEGIKEIGESAFSSCLGLREVQIPGSVTHIEGYAFQQTPWLEAQGEFAVVNGILLAYQGNEKDVTIPQGIASLGESSFSMNQTLEHITISKGVENIDSCAFLFCPNLKSVSLPEGLRRIGSLAFLNCENLGGAVIPETVSEIGEGAFSGCAKISTIEVRPGNPSFLSEGGVLFNKGKTTLYCYPSGKGDTSYRIPEEVKEIAPSAFRGCKNLVEVTMGETVTDIGESAFQSCDSLESIVLPKSVQRIGAVAFWLCGKLKSITILNSRCIFLSSAELPEEYCISAGAVIYGYSDSAAQEYAKKYGRTFVSLGMEPGEKENSLPTGMKWTVAKAAYVITASGKQAAYAGTTDKKVAKLSIPNTVTISGVTYPVTSISAGAFQGCKKLKSVTIGKNVADIGARTFSKCTALTKIILPVKLRKIGKQAFSGCKRLKNITIRSKQLKSVGKNAFQGIHAKAKIKVPKAKLKAYKKLLKKKGQGKQVKITK